MCVVGSKLWKVVGYAVFPNHVNDKKHVFGSKSPNSDFRNQTPLKILTILISPMFNLLIHFQRALNHYHRIIFSWDISKCPENHCFSPLWWWCPFFQSFPGGGGGGVGIKWEDQLLVGWYGFNFLSPLTTGSKWGGGGVLLKIEFGINFYSLELSITKCNVCDWIV